MKQPPPENIHDTVRQKTEEVTGTFWCGGCRMPRPLHMKKIKPSRVKLVRCTICMERTKSS